ncbi:MFS transporter [Rhodoferax sp.]|uniref:MFS transporter n=1 Tax=Rhodoferax sp. TaxID=50421 RepID=UPI00262F76DA|nr:MFS transporter [Rhodoferax sp.]MDD3935404.1 MFS transporter [Rhodoferax sp.]
MTTPGASFRTQDGWRYGLLGLPLAFCALPLYVLMPNLYARQWGVSLAALGAVLLAARLLDAVLDPWLGRVCDRLFARSIAAVLAFGAVAAGLLGLGFSAIFLPPLRTPDALLWWAGGWLLLTYLAYSALAVAHQSWGAMLGGDALQRSRVVAWREGLGLVGVVLAAVVGNMLGVPVMLLLLWLTLGLGWWAWSCAPRPARSAAAPVAAAPSLWHPWRRSAFRRLLAVFMLNGIASAIPATLVLFFVQDRLLGSEALQSAALGLYFVCAALSMPLWLRAVARFGLARSWLLGMGLSVLVFLWASQLGAGDGALFLIVCALSGAALGSDLALPGAMLAGLIHEAGDRGRADGAYFGWWNFATKLNLALAAGLALPLLGWLGYAPGARDAYALQVLTVAYCLLPCGLKTGAALLLHFFYRQPAARPLSP